MEDDLLQVYEAVIWTFDPEVPGRRDIVYAKSYDDAKKKLIEIYGEDNFFYVHNEERSNRAR